MQLRAFSVEEFCERYGIGRTSAYGEMRSGRLRAVKRGRRTLITYEAANLARGVTGANAASAGAPK